MSRNGIIALIVVFVVGFLLLAIASRGYREVGAMQSMEAAIEAVRKNHPLADRVSTETLAEKFEGTLLIDARSDEEFAVSRIAGAVRLGDRGEVKEFLKDRSASDGRNIVVYDSTGERSAKLVEALVTEDIVAGYLEGGIFQWANEGRPLVDSGGKSTTAVHPYNKWWGRLLKKTSSK